MKDTSDSALGWLAGVFDCDSCIYIARNDRTNRPTLRNFRAEVTVEGTDPRKPYECYLITGKGDIRHAKTHPEGSTKSNTVKWRVRGKDAAEVLRAVLPYMKSKKEQAELVLEFYTHVKEHWRDLTPEDLASQGNAYYELPILKTKHSLARKIWIKPDE